MNVLGSTPRRKRRYGDGLSRKIEPSTKGPKVNDPTGLLATLTLQFERASEAGDSDGLEASECPSFRNEPPLQRFTSSNV